MVASQKKAQPIKNKKNLKSFNKKKDRRRIFHINNSFKSRTEPKFQQMLEPCLNSYNHNKLEQSIV